MVRHFERMIFSENRLVGIVRYSNSTVVKSAGSTISSTWQSSE
jgi:hypothetical protein